MRNLGLWKKDDFFLLGIDSTHDTKQDCQVWDNGISQQPKQKKASNIKKVGYRCIYNNQFYSHNGCDKHIWQP